MRQRAHHVLLDTAGDGGATGSDGGPSLDGGAATYELPAGTGNIGPVQLGYDEARNLNDPLTMCLTAQVRAALSVPTDDDVYGSPPSGLFHLSLEPRSRTDMEFNRFATGRAVYFYQQDTPTAEPDVFSVVRYMALALTPTGPDGWTDIPEPGTTLISHIATSTISDVGVLQVTELDPALPYGYRYVDLRPCASLLFQVPVTDF